MWFWNVLIVFLLSMAPLVELRLAIPVGVLTGTTTIFGVTFTGMGMHPLIVLPIAIVGNILIGLIIYQILHWLDMYLRRSFMQSVYVKVLDRAHAKVAPYVKKYGVLGVALFIAVPLPGSGVYMGSVGAYVLGLSREAHKRACIIGVSIAGIIVTILTVGIDWIVRLF